MALAVGVLMDPIAAIKIGKDSTFAMLLEAQRRGHRLRYATDDTLAVRDGRAWAWLRDAITSCRRVRIVRAAETALVTVMQGSLAESAAVGNACRRMRIRIFQPARPGVPQREPRPGPRRIRCVRFLPSAAAFAS